MTELLFKDPAEAFEHGADLRDARDEAWSRYEQEHEPPKANGAAPDTIAFVDPADWQNKPVPERK